MRVVEVESFPISIPLDSPVAFSTRVIEQRDHAITYVRTEDGTEGVGYSLGYGSSDLIADAVNRVLAPIVEGEDPRDTERLWREMFDGTVQVGRKGAFLRAISTVDIALWDVVAKAADTPLYKLLGANTDSVPSYASGGYYRDEKSHEGLRSEMERYVGEGHDVVKMKVGRRSTPEEVERVRAVRETIGPDRTLLLDANGAYKNEADALRACRAFGEFDPYFIEEPAMPDSVDLLSRINRSLPYPVATGELEGSRYGFADLLRADAAGILQPDATVVGGITEWLKVANTAATFDIPVAPHYNWNLHTTLLAAVENGLWVEYFYRDMDVKVFDDVVADPVTPDEEGMLSPPDRPGHGVELDHAAVESFRGMP